MPNAIGVPGVKGIKGAFGDFAFGAVGGLIFLLAYQVFGAIGVLAAPLIAGSMIKGNRGEVIATMAGFFLLAAGAFALGSGNSSNSGSQTEVI